MRATKQNSKSECSPGQLQPIADDSEFGDTTSPPSAVGREAARRRPGASPGREACDTVEAWRDACRAADDGNRDVVAGGDDHEETYAQWLKTFRPGPLLRHQKFVLQTFLERDCHDAGTLALALMDGQFLFPKEESERQRKRAQKVMKAYRIIAIELLSLLKTSGYLFRDKFGWLRPTTLGSEGLPPRRRAEMFLEELRFKGVTVNLKDGAPSLNFTDAKPHVNRTEVRGVATLLKPEILEILTSKTRPADTNGGGR